MHTDPAVLLKAIMRVAEQLQLTEALPDILGVESSGWTHIRSGERQLDPTREEWQNAIRFASLFRSLLTLVGNAENARAWLSTAHQTLGAAPSSLLRTQEGRERVYRYLDAVQKFEIKLPPRSGRL